MSEYAQAAAAVKGSPVPEKSNGLCCVSGCQLPGALSTNTLGSSEWFCRLHFGSTYADQGKITALAANRHALYKLALRCINVPPGRSIPKELTAALKRHGRPDLLNATPAVEGRPLTVATLGKHMLQILDAECVQPQQRIDVEQKPTAAAPDTWTPAADLAGVFAE